MDDVGKKQMRELKATARAFQEVFSGKSGKKVLEYLKDTYHFRSTTFRDGLDAIAYSEGQRTVVLDIQDKLEQDIKEEVDG